MTKVSLKNLILQGTATPNTKSWEYATHKTLESENKGLQSRGMLVPIDSTLTRSDLSAIGSSSLGGATVETTLEDQITSAVFPHSVCVQLGAKVFTNRQGNFVIPRMSVFPDTYAASGENVTVSVDASTRFSQLVLTPQRIESEVLISRQLLVQARDRAVETFIADQCWKAIGTKLDQYALAGNSVGYAPITGLLNLTANTGSNIDPSLLAPSITYGASVSWTMINQQIYNVSSLNYPDEGRGWVLSPAARQKLAITAKSANNSTFLYDYQDGGTIAGHPALETTNLTASGNQMIFGNWANLAIVFWGNAIDILSDPFTYASQGIVRIRVTALANAGPIVGSFSCSTDSASQ